MTDRGDGLVGGAVLGSSVRGSLVNEPMTPELANVRIKAELERLMGADSPFRVGTLFLSYADPGGDGCRVAHGTGMQALTVDCAFDVLQMIKALRRVADHLEAVMRGKQPPSTNITEVL